MKLLVSVLATVLYILPSLAGQATLDWDPSPAPDILGYKLYYGVAPSSYTNVLTVGNTTSATVSSLLPGVTYYFAATAIGSNGLESDFSNEVGHTVPDGTTPPASISLSNLAQTYDGQPKRVQAQTVPAGLTVSITYNGSTTEPTAAGSYWVVATAASSGGTATASGTLVISKALAGVTIASVTRPYTGGPLPAAVTTSPAGLNVVVTYNGSLTVPSQPGTYIVVATVDDPNCTGTGEGILQIKRLSPPGGLRPIVATGG